MDQDPISKYCFYSQWGFSFLYWWVLLDFHSSPRLRLVSTDKIHFRFRAISVYYAVIPSNSNWGREATFHGELRSCLMDDFRKNPFQNLSSVSSTLVSSFFFGFTNWTWDYLAHCQLLVMASWCEFFNCFLLTSS